MLKIVFGVQLYPFQPGLHAAEGLTSGLNKSLKELETSSVDIYYLHAADRSVPFETTLEALNKLHQEGKFKELGLSNFTAYEVAEIAVLCKERGWIRPTVYQAKYNAISMLYSFHHTLSAECLRNFLQF